MADNRSPTQGQLQEKKELFTRTVTVVYERIYDETGPARTPVSVIEATLVGVAYNIDEIWSLPAAKIKECHARMLQHEEFSEQRLSEGLAGKQRLIARIGAAVNAFANG